MIPDNFDIDNEEELPESGESFVEEKRPIIGSTATFVALRSQFDF